MQMVSQVAQRHLISELVTTFTNKLLPKQITDFQAVYLINRVLVPTILARCILMVPSQAECLRWMRQCLNVVKRKASLPRDTPNAIMFHSRFYKLTDLYNALGEMHISELWLRLNSPPSSLAGKLSHLRLFALQAARVTMVSPVAQPTSEGSRHGSNIIARILPMMAERDVQFNVPSGWGVVTKGSIGISSLFCNWADFRPHRTKLKHHGLIALEQLLSPDCQVLLSWKELQSLIPTLSHATPLWFKEIESRLAVNSSHDYQCLITLPPALGPPMLPNPFRNSCLSFSPIVALPDDFVAVFPSTYTEDGVYFLAKLVGWKGGGKDEPVSYHLQHWRLAEHHDDPGGVLSEKGYYLKCNGDCDAPQPCEICGTGCCWWESGGVARLTYEVWCGSFHQVNFIGDIVDTLQFVCVDASQDELDELWQQLPDVDADGLVVDSERSPTPPPPPSPRLQAPLALLGSGASNADPVWSTLQAPEYLGEEAGGLTVFSDGSVQGAGQPGCHGGAGLAVINHEKSLWEVAVRVGGWLSSTKTEVYACIMALATLPVHQPLQLYTDSQCLLSGFHKFVSEAHLLPFRHLLRTRFYQEWSVLRQIVALRTAPVTLVKVAAHTGNFGNELADQVAKQGAAKGMLWTPTFHATSDITFFPSHGTEHPVEGDLQSYLKMQSQL